MWSDQADPAALQTAIDALRSVLPPSTGDTAPIVERLAGTATPEQVADLCHHLPGFVWLDGAHTRHLLFHDPLAVISSQSGRVTVEGPHGSSAFEAKSLDALDAALKAWPATSAAKLVGWIGYEVGDELEPAIQAPAAPLPNLHFALYDSVLLYENERWVWQATRTWREPPTPHALLARAEAHKLPVPAPAMATIPEATGEAAFVSSVEHLVRHIHAGDLFQTNLCRHLRFPFQPARAWPLYRSMRASNPAVAGAFLQLGNGRTILSGSPELFLRVRDGIVESTPIKGTRRRGQTATEDIELALDLLTSEKDRAELAMVVDVTRNDLSRVCLPGTVEVPEHATLMTLPTLHHTYSRVTGKLRPATNSADLLKAAFPPASITGAPKIAAMKAAFHEEGTARGPCMGAIGWLSWNGDTELSVAIRTAYTDAGSIRYLAGCGITSESDPAAEFAESEAKAAAFLTALQICQNPCGPVIAASPDDGADEVQSQT